MVRSGMNFQISGVALALLLGCATSQLAPYVPADSYDTLYIPSTFEDKYTQTNLLANLGDSIDGIKLLLTSGKRLGSGFQSLPDLPAELASDPGLSLLATATQAYLAFIGGVLDVGAYAPAGFKKPTNSWWHAASSYVPGAPLIGNGGTFYSLLYYSLKDGPLLFSTPAYNGPNLWTIYFHDAYGDAYLRIGSAYGNNVGGKYLIVPPGYSEPAPDSSYTVIQAPTVEGLLLGRTYQQPDANSAVAFDLAWTGGLYNNGSSSVPLALWPWAYPETSAAAVSYDNPSDPLLFWRVAGEIYRRNGAPNIVDPLLRLLPSIGFYKDFGFVQTGLSSVLKSALTLAPYYGNRILVAKNTFLGPPSLNYWLAPEGDGAFGSDYVLSAAIMRGFWVANKIQDAAYYYQYLDSDAQPLFGDNNYTIIFPNVPPIGAGAFWALVAYNSDNWKSQYSATGPTTSSINVGFFVQSDGSIPFVLSSTPPPANTTATQRGYNFVQLPKGAHTYLILRVYAPQQSVLDNTYAPPPVVRTTGRRKLSAARR